MQISRLLVPITSVPWLAVTDNVQDAFDHLESHEVTAVPLLDWAGNYVGTVTEADLRRHVANAPDREAAYATKLGDLDRRSNNPAVSIDRDLRSLLDHASLHRFIPIVDDTGKLLGIVDRRRVLSTLVPPRAA